MSSKRKRPHAASDDSSRNLQIGAQVREAVTYALLSSTSPILRELSVVSVEPTRGAAQLRVVVQQADDDFDETQAALERATGYIRAEVTRSINRKHAPNLELVLVAAE